MSCCDLQKDTNVPFYQKDAHLQGVDGRSQMWSGLPRHVPWKSLIVLPPCLLLLPNNILFLESIPYLEQYFLFL
jgi:hypothetical protein